MCNQYNYPSQIILECPSWMLFKKQLIAFGNALFCQLWVTEQVLLLGIQTTTVTVIHKLSEHQKYKFFAPLSETPVPARVPCYLINATEKYRKNKFGG